MDLPPNWTRYQTDDGKDYYHNSVTNVTQWEPPAPEAPAAPTGVYQPDLNSLDLQTQKVDANAAVGQGMGATVVDGNQAGAQGNTMFSRYCWCLDINYLQQFFDVTTEDVAARVKAAAIPKPEADHTVLEAMRLKPDFYGPFWIATTAVIFLAATGNYGQVLSTNDELTTNWDLVGVAACMVYGCLAGVPLLSQALFMFAGEEVATELNLKQMICVYGYSFTVLIPMTLLMLVPISFLKWIFACVGFAASCLFVRNHLWTEISVNGSNKTKYGLIFLLFGAHAFVYFFYLTYFFTPTKHQVKHHVES